MLAGKNNRQAKPVNKKIAVILPGTNSRQRKEKAMPPGSFSGVNKIFTRFCCQTAIFDKKSPNNKARANCPGEKRSGKIIYLAVDTRNMIN